MCQKLIFHVKCRLPTWPMVWNMIWSESDSWKSDLRVSYYNYITNRHFGIFKPVTKGHTSTIFFLVWWSFCIIHNNSTSNKDIVTWNSNKRSYFSNLSLAWSWILYTASGPHDATESWLPRAKFMARRTPLICKTWIKHTLDLQLKEKDL